MALGTIVSRATGFLRMGLLLVVIGRSLNADMFDSANTIPNTLYILLAGGVFNVVLVPQLIRAMKNDPDGGDAYANRIITLGLLVLGFGTLGQKHAVLHFFVAGLRYQDGRIRCPLNLLQNGAHPGRRLFRLLGQNAHLVRHNRKTLSLLPGAGCFDSGIKCNKLD